MTIFTRKKAQLGLLITMHDELVKKIDEQIGIERRFIESLEKYFNFEQRFKAEMLRRERLEEEEKKPGPKDLMY
jgi:hypothetical protein